MSTFYQSDLRRQINETIYRKPIFTYRLDDREYRGTIKSQRIMGKELRRSMIHGVELSADAYDAGFHTSLQHYHRDHQSGNDLFLQVGIMTPLSAYSTTQGEKQREEVIKKQSYVERDLLTRYDLRPTIREHMPHASIILDAAGTMEEHIRACSESGRRMMRKGQKASLSFETATPDEWKTFWQLRYSMSYDKGFSIVPEAQFISLMELLHETSQGRLFIAKKDDQIVSGSVCLQIEKQLVYLYGATDRAFGAIGAHHRLTIQILSRAREHHLSSFDLLGIASPGAAADHPLQGVTRFKQSFGGETIVYTGAYDLVCSPRGYRAFKLWRKTR